MPFQGPKKSRFSGPAPSNAPRNDVAALKTIMYRAIKTTGTFIVKKLFSSPFGGPETIVVQSLWGDFYDFLTGNEMNIFE